MDVLLDQKKNAECLEKEEISITWMWVAALFLNLSTNAKWALNARRPVWIVIVLDTRFL